MTIFGSELYSVIATRFVGPLSDVAMIGPAIVLVSQIPGKRDQKANVEPLPTVPRNNTVESNTKPTDKPAQPYMGRMAIAVRLPQIVPVVEFVGVFSPAPFGVTNRSCFCKRGEHQQFTCSFAFCEGRYRLPSRCLD